MASSVAVGAFTAPSSSVGIHNRVFSPSRQPKHLGHFYPLQLSTNDNSITTESKDAISLRQEAEVPINVRVLVVSALLGFTSVVHKLQMYLNTPCLNGSEVCTVQHHDFAQFFNEHEIASFLLVLTHSIPFALLPWVSKQVSKNGRMIQKDFEEFNPFIMQMAMTCIGFGLSLEVGWHVADSWYYDNNFHVLNFGFYFFLISGFALWADGFKNTAFMDLVFGGILLAASILYPFGNAVGVGAMEEVPTFLRGFLADPGVAKIPLYVGMSATFTSITLRGREIFGNKMFIVAFLSIVVNLFFIFILSNYAFQPDQGYEDLSIMNYVYHICHDFLGTEAGVFYFGLLIKNYVPLAERLEEESNI